jgi:hypothetical protein
VTLLDLPTVWLNRNTQASEILGQFLFLTLGTSVVLVLFAISENEDRFLNFEREKTWADA